MEKLFVHDKYIKIIFQIY